MLSIGKLAAGKEQYYLDNVAQGQEDYYSGKGETPGEWTGKGAAELGLSGDVKPDDFTAVISGQHRDRELRSAKANVSVTGYDLTFSAPKSVSLLYGIGDPEVSRAAREVHDHAVREALGYLEREAAFVRRGPRGRHVLPASGVVAAAFRHRSSRAGDPQLHTHAVVANTGHADGRWSALDGRRLYAHARTAGYLYQAALRDGLTRELGVQWLEVHNGMAEISGVPQEVLRHFSRRSFELEEHLNQVGRSSRKAREIAALESRKRKDYAVSPTHLHDSWRARAAEFGFDRQAISRLVGHELDGPPDQDLAAAAERMSAAHGITQQASTFDRRDVIRDWAAGHRSGAPVDQIERLADAWLKTPDVVGLPGREAGYGGRRFSTKEMLETERRLIESCRRRVGEQVAIAQRDDVEQSLRERPSVTHEQAVVIRSLTRSGDGVQVLRAAAGTGKTFALDAAREAWEASDVTVIGCALSARAAVELQSQSGIRSDTVASLERQLTRGTGIPKDGVLVVDEAGMVGSRHLDRLAGAAERAGTKLVLVGDDHQLPEIDAGGAFRGIAKRIGALELRTVMRQRNEWDREALDHLRHGRVDEWAREYRQRGRIFSHPTAEGARSSLVGDWWVAAREPRTDAIMIAHRRSDVADLNERARELMHEDRRLGADEVTADGRQFATGDLVLARRNDRRLHIVNGTRGEVTAVDPEHRTVTVETISGDSVTLSSRYLDAGHLEHGYAMTAHAAQGATVDKAFVLGSDDLYREWGYTALSRHRDEARYYAVSAGRPEETLPGLEPTPDPLLEDVVEALASSRQKDLAIDALGDRQIESREAAPSTFAELRNSEREILRASVEAERVAARLRDAELQQGALEAALDATPRRKVSARAELRVAIERQRELVDGWRANATEVHAGLEESGVRNALLRQSLGVEPDAAVDLEHVEPSTPARDVAPSLDAGPDLGP